MDAASHEGELESSALEKVVEYNSLTELLIPFYIPSVFGFTVRGFVLAVLPLHALALGYSYDQVGFFGTCSGVGVIGGNIPSGAFMSAKGPRALLVLSLFCHAVAAGCVLLLPGDGMWCTILIGIAFLLNGFGETAGILARQTVLAAAVPKSFRGSASSALGGTGRIAFALGPSVAGWIADARGLHSVYALQLTLAIATACLTMISMPYISSTQSLDTRSPDAKVKSGSSTEGRLSLVGVVRHHWRVLASVCTFVCALTCLRQARILLFPLEGHERQGSQSFIGNFTAVSYFIDFLFFPIAGKLLDGVGRTWTGALSSSVSVVGFACLQLRTPLGFVAFAVVSGIGNGLSSGIALTLGSDLAPPDCRAQFLTVYRILMRSADILTPAIIGLITEKFSLQLAGLAVCAIGVFGTIWALTCVTETLQREKPVSRQAESKSESGVQPGGIGKYQNLEQATETSHVDVGDAEMQGSVAQSDPNQGDAIVHQKAKVKKDKNDIKTGEASLEESQGLIGKSLPLQTEAAFETPVYLKGAGLEYTPEEQACGQEVAPMDVLDDTSSAT